MGGYTTEWLEIIRAFQIGSIWLSNAVTFVHVSDPFAETSSPELDGKGPTPGQSPYVQQQHDWEAEDGFPDLSSGLSPLGLEALSAAALYTPQGVNAIPRPEPFTDGINSSVVEPATPGVDITTVTISPIPLMTAASSNKSFILNHTSAGSPSIDSSLQSSQPTQSPHYVRSTSSQNDTSEPQSEIHISTESELMLLLRHFSEMPGQWSVE